MAKKTSDKSQYTAIRQDQSGVITDRKKDGRGGETITIRSSKGEFRTLKTKESSVRSMDQTTKKFAGALKRLAKR